VLLALAWAKLRNGQPEAALAAIERAGSTGSAAAHLLRSWALVRLQRINDARRAGASYLGARAVEAGPEPEKRIEET
jgi:hypothetical protein